MKRIIFTALTLVVLCTLLQGKTRSVIENDSLGHIKRTIELRDTLIDGIVKTDTLSITTYDSPTSPIHADESAANTYSEKNGNHFVKNQTIIAVTGIIFIFGMPIFIMLIYFYFRYKNRQAKYRLAEQMLNAGQTIPNNFFAEEKNNDLRSKGISSIFVGIGLFIFLWAITGEFGIGCVGLFIMFTGFGQVIIYYLQHPHENTPFRKTDNNE